VTANFRHDLLILSAERDADDVVAARPGRWSGASDRERPITLSPCRVMEN
jgi:hypothetical protein